MAENMCGNCFHPKENHPGDGHFCTRELTCMCQKYVEPELVQFALLVEKAKAERKTIYKRCYFILDKIPPTRNASEKSFGKIYREIWYGFKIRKEGTKLTTEEFKRMPGDDPINREKRRVKADYPELATYNPQTIQNQSILFQAYMELAVE